MVLSVSLLVLVGTGLLSCALCMVLSVSLLVLVGTGLLSCALRMVLSVSLLVLFACRAKIDVLSDRKRVRVLATKPRVGWGRLIAQIEAGVHADLLSYFLGPEVENKFGKSGLPVQKSCVFRSASPRPRRSVGEGRPTHL